MTETCDVLIIGAGIAGASAGFELSRDARVIVLEQESQPGYHTTGRSAALFTETYGNRTIRQLTSAGRAFFENPPDGFADHPLLNPRGTLFLARDDQLGSLETALAETPTSAEAVRRLDAGEVRELNPSVRPGYAAAGLFEPSARDIDVHALHGGFLRGAAARGGRIVIRARVTGLAREGGAWVAETSAGRFAAPVVVNAAGAWCDEVAGLAGLPPVGLVPKRRTAFTFDPPDGVDPSPWPATIDIDEQFFFRPEAGRIMGSPADETPSPPCDAQPEEIDVAIGVDRIETATVMTVRRLVTKWAGLRSFVADKTPVVGFDAGAEGFFWLAGQGGYGIQTSPALGRVTAALITTGDLPEDLKARELDRTMLWPERLGRIG
ncbi:MAG TPA: FAD-binding oxidoreductase [Thermohalobaculum sp.]|nr:FAD-binding oxidoreductase [Thermohalobaculum sp.]